MNPGDLCKFHCGYCATCGGESFEGLVPEELGKVVLWKESSDAFKHKGNRGKKLAEYICDRADCCSVGLIVKVRNDEAQVVTSSGSIGWVAKFEVSQIDGKAW